MPSSRSRQRGSADRTGSMVADRSSPPISGHAKSAAGPGCAGTNGHTREPSTKGARLGDADGQYGTERDCYIEDGCTVEIMDQYRIAVIVGSLRKDSFNRQLANAIVKLAPPEFTFSHVEIGDLPLYNQDDDEHQAESVIRMKRAVSEADGLLFVTPEYNRSIPGVLKNALDHGSRPYGQNVWAGKPAGVLGASPGNTGTAMAQQHLRNILSFLDIPTQNQPEAYVQVREGLFDEQGEIGERSRPYLQNWMDHFVEWVEAGAWLRSRTV